MSRVNKKQHKLRVFTYLALSVFVCVIMLSQVSTVQASNYSLILKLDESLYGNARAVAPQSQRSSSKPVASTKIGLASNGIIVNWTAVVRFENGQIFSLERINIMETDGGLSGFVYNGTEANALVKGTYGGNNFSLQVEYYFTNSPTRIPPQLQFDGQINGNSAAGTVLYRDSYQKTFKGTFSFARYGYKVTPPIPDNSGDSGVSVINGAWRGEFIPYNSVIGGKGATLTLNLRQEGANIVGTGTLNNNVIPGVKGVVTGSTFTLVLGDYSNGRIEIKGQVSSDAIIGDAIVYAGGQQEIHTFGKVRFTKL